MLRVLILLLFALPATAQTGWYLKGDTLRYSDGINATVQINKTGLFPTKTDLTDSLNTRLLTRVTTATTDSMRTNIYTAINGKQASGSYATTATTDSMRTNIYAAINGKQPTITSNSISTSSIINYTGYTLSVQGLTSSPTDAQTIYFGNLPKAPVTAAATSKIYIRKAGTIKVAEIYCYSGTAGTNEAWVMSIRLNNTTDTQIASVSLATSERVFSNTGLSIAVSAGDYIEIKCVNPTWATNPLTCIFGGYIYIE